jgi:hypothetical protein
MASLKNVWRNRGVERVEVGVLALVGAVEQLVVEVEDARVAQLLVLPEPGVRLPGRGELLVEEELRIVARARCRRRRRTTA